MNIDTTANTHTYKLKPGILAMNVIVLFLYVFMIGPLIAGFVSLAILFAQKGSVSSSYELLIALPLLLLSLLLVVSFLVMAVNVVLLFFSYIKISPEGIEQKNPLYRHIRCNWSDVDRLGKLLFFTDVVYIHAYQQLGPSLSMKLSFWLYSPHQGFFTLNNYEGWPNGALAADLKRYAPRLYETQPASNTALTGNQGAQHAETPDSIQDKRTLAAVCHASAFLSVSGILFPLVIYFTQKGKSPYVRFHALQALAWQLIACVFNTLAWGCLFATFMVPIFIAASTQNRAVDVFYSAGMMAIWLVGGFILAMGNVVFALYGMAGAVRTYQGNDFRYIFIADRIQPGSSPRNQ